MNYYFEPVNLKQWNMFENVKTENHVEHFLAVKSMKLGDIVLLHVGKQDKKKVSGVYAYGEIIKAPYILKNSPNEYCNGKNTVDVQFIKISYGNPLIDEHICKRIFNQFRSVHLLKNKGVSELLNIMQF